MSGDNFHFDITGADLETSLKIAFMGAPGAKVAAWKTEKGRPDEPPYKDRLILAWNSTDGFVELPAPLKLDATIPFAKSWLAEADYGPQPDHDGDNGKGWRVYNESWGRIAQEFYAFCAIEPVWIMYGK